MATMAKRLTEEMVIARTKISDLSKIRRLNCWGSELVDVSLLRKMPCVEVVSLSINKINSLQDFQFCRSLAELYIRQNDIRDINEVVYLQNLPNLKSLWLGENPCANVDGYRLTVIKALPQLQKLDNIAVTAEELREAQKRGRTLTHPDDPQESEEEYAPTPQQPQQQYNRYQDYSDDYGSPVQRSPPPRQETTDYELEDSEDIYPREEASEGSRESMETSPPPSQVSPPRRTEAIRAYSPEPEYDRRRSSYESRESPKQNQYYEKTTTTNNSFEETISCDNHCREVKLVTSQSASCIKEYANGDRYVPNQHGYTRQSGDDRSDVQSVHGHEKRCPASAFRNNPFSNQRRPVTRNSNILSAVLCLVKELDYPSLEVVEMAVRCRMDELDE
ncbi:dynein axonemal assembly factor 11 isoform X1 [Aethina tumida]|uniref:dynein axonemal assembly factor 11 isoform X1 n=1 Tax=Aethina tumida TaxID=116153 RepID=UPI00214918C0|nr:dynein axonemal assembly factor 11 isoform X1 [Aethina tumida]